MGTDGDHNTAGLKATAMRLVNAMPEVMERNPDWSPLSTSPYRRTGAGHLILGRCPAGRRGRPRRGEQ